MFQREHVHATVKKAPGFRGFAVWGRAKPARETLFRDSHRKSVGWQETPEIYIDIFERDAAVRSFPSTCGAI